VLPRDAVKVAVVLLATTEVETVNVADAEPASTVTEGGADAF